MSISRIKQFIERQRLIGENRFGQKMRSRHNKSAQEFYDQFADSVFYEKGGQKYGLDIQTLWHFRTKDMMLEEKDNRIKELEEFIGLIESEMGVEEFRLLQEKYNQK